MSDTANDRPKTPLSKSGQMALSYARRGWYVFPVVESTKQPRVKWSQRASKDRAQVAGWWARYPNDNIGIACGPSGLCVIDLDLRANKDGRRELDGLEVVNGSLGDTLTARTPSGGTHLYFSGAVKCSIGKLASGIDVKSLGGYVLAPGSKTAAGEYTWAYETPIAELPVWLSALMSAPTHKKDERVEEPPGGFDNQSDIEWAKRMLHDTEAAAEGDGSDIQTFRLACKLRDRGLSEEIAIQLLMTEWKHQHDEVWIREKVDNAYRYASGDAGSDSTAAFDDPPDVGSKRRRFQPLSFGELSDWTAPKWLAERLIPAGGLAVVYGRPKAGKTFWSLDLSLSVATGRSFHGISVNRGRTTYVAAEGGPARLRDRVAAWLRHRGADESELSGWWDLVISPVDLIDRGQVGQLLKELRQPRDLVILDTLARCMSGDENTQKDMSAAVAGCDRLRSELSAAVLLVHHEGKDGSKGARGSTVLRGAIDTGVRARSEGKRIIFSVEDQRDDEPLPPTSFELAPVVLSNDMSSAVLVPVVDGASDDLDILKIRDMAAAMNGASKKDLIATVAAELHLTSITARRRVDAAVPRGRDSAVEHAEGLLWLEPHPTNPQGPVTVRFANAAE